MVDLTLHVPPHDEEVFEAVWEARVKPHRHGQVCERAEGH
jgi:hypothetical protein